MTSALEAYAQRIRMTMSATRVAERARVDGKLRRSVGNKQIDASVLERHRFGCGSNRLESIPLANPFYTQKPQRLLPQPACSRLEVSAMKKNGSARKRIQQVIGTVPSRIK